MYLCGVCVCVCVSGASVCVCVCVCPITYTQLSVHVHTAGQSTPQVDADAGPTAAVLSSDGSSEKCERVVRVEGLDSGTVVGIAFAAFVIGVLLTAALWYIHTHTGKSC